MVSKKQSKLVAIPTFIDLPREPDEAEDMLSAFGSLALATDWARSAIVRTLCYKSKPGPKAEEIGRDSGRSIREFAELGIIGLRDRDTVRRYYDSWDLSGMPEPVLGERVTLPDIPFPTIEELEESREGDREAKRQVEEDKKTSAETNKKETSVANWIRLSLESGSAYYDDELRDGYPDKLRQICNDTIDEWIYENTEEGDTREE
jgi:hypothetical protein